MCIGTMGHLRPLQGGMLLFECLNGTVDRACAFGEHQHASAGFEGLCELVHGLFRRSTIAALYENRSANSFNFPKSGTLRMLALLRKTMGQGLALNAALMSMRLA